MKHFSKVFSFYSRAYQRAAGLVEKLEKPKNPKRNRTTGNPVFRFFESFDRGGSPGGVTGEGVSNPCDPSPHDRSVPFSCTTAKLIGGGHAPHGTKPYGHLDSYGTEEPAP